jgi:hypothetical protein
LSATPLTGGRIIESSEENMAEAIFRRKRRDRLEWKPAFRDTVTAPVE